MASQIEVLVHETACVIFRPHACRSLVQNFVLLLPAHSHTSRSNCEGLFAGPSAFLSKPTFWSFVSKHPLACYVLESGLTLNMLSTLSVTGMPLL